jgi:hypothetical protein
MIIDNQQFHANNIIIQPNEQSSAPGKKAD